MQKYAQMPLEDSNDTKHQHYQAIALHMWKVCGVTDKISVSVALCQAVFLLPGGEEAFQSVPNVK